MKRAILVTLLCIAGYHTAGAVDSQVSIEYDHTRNGYNNADIQINIGQRALNDLIRPYINVELAYDNYNYKFIGNTATLRHAYRMDTIDYRVGSEYNLNKSIKFDAGMGLYGYNNNLNAYNVPYAYTKATWIFDNESKGDNK